MLKDNLKALRKARGLSQQELAEKCNVVRQTVSKWEQGLSVPDSQMLLVLSEVLQVPVNAILEEAPVEAAELAGSIPQRREEWNRETGRKILHWLMISLLAAIAAGYAVLGVFGSAYLGWDFSDPEIAVVGTILHGLEWVFVRTAPIAVLGLLAGIFLTRKKKEA